MSEKSSSEKQKEKPRVKVEVVSEQEFRHKKKYATRPVYDYDTEKVKIWAALGYLFFAIPLIAAPKNVFARFHANQGLLFLLYIIAINLLGVIPFIGWFIILPLGNLLGLFFLLYGAMMALNGWKQRLPFIGDFDFISISEDRKN